MLIGIDASRANTTRRSGIENYSLQMILALARQDASHRYRLYLREEPIPELAQLPAAFEWSVVRPPAYWQALRRVLPLPPLWTQLGLRQELAARPVDLLFVPGHTLPPGYGGKSVAVIHDLAYLHIPDSYAAADRRRLQRATDRNVRLATHLIAVSDHTRQDVIETYGVSPDRITRIYPGVDRQLFRRRRRQDIAPVLGGLGVQAPYFLYVGNIQPKKGLDTLIAAFAACRYTRFAAAGKHDDAGLPQLVIVGRGAGAERRALETLARDGLAAGALRWLDFQPDEIVAALMAGCRAYVQPSRYEGFGMPVAEALRCGAPVIVSDGGALPEVAGTAGRVFPVGDVAALTAHLQAALETPETAPAPTDGASPFDWDAAARRLLDVFEKAAS
jgi:glycosyltransferase involved in cell wall biosynthesis